MRVYLDANAIIYSIEGAPSFRGAVVHWFRLVEASDGFFVTSRLARLECRVKPLRDAHLEMLAQYEGFFERANLSLTEIDAEVVELATELRARYNFRAPDSIHLATAIRERADIFLTGDANLARCSELRVEILTPSPSH